MIFGNRKEYEKDEPFLTKDICPFCNYSGEEKKYLVSETKYWSIRYNKYPYYGKEKHLMAVPKKHKIYTTELSLEELKDFKNVEKFMADYYKGESNYFSFIRQGLGGRSVEHMHYHYLPWHISFNGTENNPSFKIKNK